MVGGEGGAVLGDDTTKGGAQGGKQGGFPDKWRSSSPAESRHWRENQLPVAFVKASIVSASFARLFITAPIWGQI